jgi:hypothetical protein
MIEPGIFCSFDYTQEAHRKAFAKSAVDYVDAVIPIIFNKMGLALPNEHLEINIIDGTPYPMFCHDGIKREIKINKGFDEEDLGMFIHECVHWTQLTNDVFYKANEFICEGIADYFRVILSLDKKGDCGQFNDSKKCLVKNLSKAVIYDSASEYIAYLRIKSNNNQIIQLLNDAIRSNNQQNIDDFFINYFQMSHNELYYEYKSERTKYAGKKPQQTLRFEYFTKP